MLRADVACTARRPGLCLQPCGRHAARRTPLSADRPLHRRRWPWIALLGSCVLAAILGGTSGYFLRLDLPDVRALEDYNPPVMSRVLAGDDSVVATFAEQRRMLIEFHEIPVEFRQALIAVEDQNFMRHTGIDVRGIVRALWLDLKERSWAQGASTLTQQLARNLFLHPDKTLRRKAQEAMLAVEIERNYTKEEILRFYANQVYMGHGRYGLAAASRYYFDKPPEELTLPEAATIAGLLQRPESLSPFKNPERSLDRRNHVIGRMLAEGMIDAETADWARSQPLGVVSTASRSENPAPFFIEEVRRWVQERHGSSNLYKEGFEVRTTLDSEMQAAANRAVEMGLRQLDKRQGWRGATEHVPDGDDPETWEPASWREGVREGAVHDAVVTAIDGADARLRVGTHRATLTPDGFEWTRKKRASDLMAVGDVIRVRVLSDDGETVGVELEQEPRVEAALVALEPATGAIKALVGGYDFERSEFDRAIQAKRQTGSAFKPFVYAAALANGFTLADTIVDEPTVFLGRGMPDPYQPENYTNEYYETLTLRRAIEKSANIATVRVLERVGYEPVIEMARRLGIESDLQPFPSMALGAFEVSLLELTAAYGTFANQGVLVEPHFVREIRNRQGALIQTPEPAVRDSVGPQIAFLMNRVLEGVITDGTGGGARDIDANLAGKTGTTDDNTDAWFVGYSPALAVGVWVGFDEPHSLGSRETGAQAALPIWKAFMAAVVDEDDRADFPVPPRVTFVSIDRKTGLKRNAAAGCESVISEAFIEGTEPTAYCSKAHHELLHFPYPFQRYAINEQGELEVPRNELESLLEQETDVYLVDGGRRLEAYMPDGVLSLPVKVAPPTEPAPLPTWATRRFDPSLWQGLDGRRPNVIVMR